MSSLATKYFVSSAFANGRRCVTTYTLMTKTASFVEGSSATSVTNLRHYCMQHIQAHTLDKTLLKLPLARYGGRQTVTVLAGDGIGPEMIGHIKDIFSCGVDAFSTADDYMVSRDLGNPTTSICCALPGRPERLAAIPVDFEDIKLDSTVPDSELDNAIVSIERNGVAIKGNVETKYDNPTTRSRNVELRTRLDLYANVLRVKSIPNVPCKHKDLDMFMIRENTEGEYSGIEHETIPGVVESLKIVTRRNIERIAKFAFEYAARHGRKKVTAIHKANIMKIGDGLFLRTCADMAKKYPDIQFNDLIIDNASMQLVAKPQQFDVVLMPNLYGNILSNIACGLVGGPGLVSGMNIGDKYAVFETGSRNTGTSIAGKDVANPVAFLRAAVDMLFYLGMETEAQLLKRTIIKVLSEDRIHTQDLGGTAKTSEFIAAVKNDLLSKITQYNYLQ